MKTWRLSGYPPQLAHPKWNSTFFHFSGKFLQNFSVQAQTNVVHVHLDVPESNCGVFKTVGIVFSSGKRHFQGKSCENQLKMRNFYWILCIKYMKIFTWFSFKMTFCWRKNDPDGLENTTVRFRNIQMYMNYVGLCLNIEVLKEFAWKVKKSKIPPWVR